MAYKEDPAVLPREGAVAVPMAQAIRRIRGGGAPGPSPQAEVAPSRVDPGQGRLQDQMPFRQIQIQRDAIGRDLGQGHGTRQQGREEPQDRPGEILQNPLVPFPQGPEGAGGEMGERIQRNAQDDA